MTLSEQRSGNIPSDAAHWDSGDWINWHRQNESAETDQPQPDIDQEFRLRSTYRALLQTSKLYHQVTGTHLAVYSEIAKVYAAVHFNLSLSAGHELSDGVLLCFIAPDTPDHKVSLDMTKPFEKVVVVQIDDHFNVDGRMIDRAKLPANHKQNCVLTWQDLPIHA